VFVAAIAASACATPALAQDVDSFSGFRVEALAGYDNVRVNVDEAVAGEDVSDSKGGLLYGVGVGYDHSFGNILAGVEAEVSNSTVGQDFVIDEEIDAGVPIEGTASLEAAHDIYIGARLGTRLSGATLIYLKGGYSMATAKVDANGSIDDEAGSIEADLDFEGLRLGGGVEGQLSDNVFVKNEYRYTNYSDGEIDADGASADIGDIFDYIDLNRHQVVMGIGYRF
jgi:outer membrane immunogenic protein